MSADPNQIQAQIDALNARRQMAMEMAQQPGMQQQVVNGRVMDQGFAPALQGIARLISQGRAAQMGDKIAQLTGQASAAKQQRADAALQTLMGGDQQSPAPSMPQQSAPDSSVASMFNKPEMSGSAMPQDQQQNMPLPPTVPRPMDSFLPNLQKAQAYLRAGGNPAIADAFLKQNAVENKPEKPTAAPHYQPTADGMFYDSQVNRYRDADGNVLTDKQVMDRKARLSGERASATANARNSATADVYSDADKKLLGALDNAGVTGFAGRNAQSTVARLQGLRMNNPGMSEDDIANAVRTGQLDMTGSKRSVSQLAAVANASNAQALKLEKDFASIEPLVSKMGVTGTPKIDKALAQLRTNWQSGGDKDTSEFIGWLREIAGEYAKINSGSTSNAAPAQTALNEALDTVQQAFSDGGYQGLKNAIMGGAANKRSSYQEGLQMASRRGAGVGNPTGGTAPTNKAPQAAIDYLKGHPELKEQFKAKYGYLPDG